VAYHTQLFDYTRLLVVDVQRCFVLHITFQKQHRQGLRSSETLRGVGYRLLGQAVGPIFKVF
jgi:hypothetical protein